MSSFSRADRSVIGRWWWTIDRWTLVALLLLVAIGAVLTMAASPGAAERIGLDPFHFVRNQFVFFAPSIVLLVIVSLLSHQGVRRLATIGLIITLLLMLVTLFAGHEAKGASRWLSLGGFTIQPSEFLKPFFAVVVAWMFSAQKQDSKFPGKFIACCLFFCVATLLILQPDFGMTITVTAVWFIQFFLAGLPMFWVAAALFGGLGLVVAAYTALPHVADRIDRFTNPAAGDQYQVNTSLRAFENGGLFGLGPGEGRIKEDLPDSHTDFIFAVAGEEFGALACLLVVSLFAFVVLRGFSRVLRDANLFVLLAVAGLLTQFGLQALINMGVAVRLLPAKGMTLPFVSYGGSSLIATAIGMGMVLALTRLDYLKREQIT
ncbi:MAG: putative lipid II flippase FtsW [Rhodospirillaceae bacterium]|nr:putative lipid II flippase FtsW [Alphaproteobacteria bacterium]MBR71515.1 putative lipid II flippase FtsW [Rhodospirillaceae bacterium]